MTQLSGPVEPVVPLFLGHVRCFGAEDVVGHLRNDDLGLLQHALRFLRPAETVVAIRHLYVRQQYVRVLSKLVGRRTVGHDGAIVFTTAVTDDIVGDTITIGTGMRGRVGEVRFWNTARTLAEVNAGRGQRITDGGSDAIGIWPMEEGTGQTLRDLANPSLNGWLGSAAAADDSDPAWSTDGPPL